MLTLILMAALSNNDVIDKIVNAYGGVAVWEKVESFREAGTVTSRMRSDKGQLDRTWQRPNKLRVEIVYPTHSEVRDVDGDHGTSNGAPAKGMMLDAMRLQAARLALPLLLVQKRSELKFPDATHIEVPLDGGMTLTVEFDGSGRILKTTGKGAGIEFSTTYTDFRTVDGRVFAFHEENSAQGMPTGDNEISRVDVNLRK